MTIPKMQTTAAAALALAALFAGPVAVPPARAASLYVSASADAGGDGSASAPYATIAAAVTAANERDEAETGTEIIVAAGEYAISSSDDLFSVTAANVTIRAADADSKPVVTLDANLSATLENDAPVVFEVVANANCFAVSNVIFRYHATTTQKRAGNSLGKTGRLFSVCGNNCTFEGCEFLMIGSATGNFGGSWILHNQAEQASRDSAGTYMTVRNCVFGGIEHEKTTMIRSAKATAMAGNVFTNCTARHFYQVKSTSGSFVSNRVVNCTCTINSRGEGYQENDAMVMAYNVFVNSGVPQITKTNVGMSKLRFHHNTVVGAATAIYVDDASTDVKNITTWGPYIFDNIIIAADGGSVIREDVKEAKISDSHRTSFNTGSLFSGNAWFASVFNDGNWPNSYPDRYCLYDETTEVGLKQTDNTALTIAPEFLETEDVFSENFYRINSVRYPWVKTGATAVPVSKTETYPATYIGAVEPAEIEAEPGEFFQIDEFTASLDGSDVPANLTLSVVYSQNAGIVMVYWDADGDGVYEASGEALSETIRIEKPGDYTPCVKVVDSATGREMTATYPSALKVRRGTVYVDANAEAGGDGTADAPFRTLAEGARYQTAGQRIYVRGGTDRTYTIASADDLVAITEYGVSISSYGGEGNAQVVLDAGLHAATNNPDVIAISADASHVTVSGLDFTFYGRKEGLYEGDSLGGKGCVVKAAGYYATVANCSFTLLGTIASSLPYDYDAGTGFYAVSSGAAKGAYTGSYLTVAGCRFTSTSATRQLRAVYMGYASVVTNNYLNNCSFIAVPVKQLGGMVRIIGNAMIDCASIVSTYGSYGEFQNAEIAYNVFVASDGSPFIRKTHTHGLTTDVSIHHNTAVGVSSFIRTTTTNGGYTWHPRIFDNLAVLAGDGAFISDDVTVLKDEAYSSFSTDGGATCYGNVFHGGALTGGTAAALDGYDIAKGLDVSGNLKLDAAPAFVSTEWGEENWYAPHKARNPAWCVKDFAWTDDGKWPAYVGAVEPFGSLGFFIIVR